MYPETDIPPIIITKEELKEIHKEIPKSWDESIKELQTKYKINPQLSEQIFDSRYIGLFETIVEKTKSNPTFVASVLCSSITNLERNGLDSNLLKKEDIIKSFELLKQEKIAKESIEIIFENIMSGKSETIEEALKDSSIGSIDESNLDKIIEDIVQNNSELIKNQKERAIGPLMGIAMKELRGKVSGEKINNILLKSIKEKLQSV